MSELFEAPPAFFRSRWLPAVCVVTGSRQAVTFQAVTVEAQRSWWAFRRVKAIELALPFSRRGWRLWYGKRMAWTMLAVVYVVFAILERSLGHGPQQDTVGAIGFLTLFALGALGELLDRLFLPHCKVDRFHQVVRIRMPSTTAFREFAGAFMQWKAAERIDTPIAYDLETWADGAATGWDEGQS